MSKHQIQLTNQQKVDWFNERIKERLQVKNVESEQELVDLVRGLRRWFKELYGRDVPGSFVRKLLNDLGVAREHSAGVKKKKDYMFGLMDVNVSYRENKTHLRKAVEIQFGESILNMVFNELWDEYHATDDHPEPVINVDIHGQRHLF